MLAYFISFGPHGPRAPLLPAGSTTKTFVGVAGLVGAAFALFYFIRHNGKETPKTMNKEWQQATNERLLEQKVNPITGLSSENYKGKYESTNKGHIINILRTRHGSITVIIHVDKIHWLKRKGRWLGV